MDSNIKKTAIVTGASSGIGLGIANVPSGAHGHGAHRRTRRTARAHRDGRCRVKERLTISRWEKRFRNSRASG
jgi:NAD(P)-dependent dehydrogenase (short-subunit alcohol dehydrogenase family)